MISPKQLKLKKIELKEKPTLYELAFKQRLDNFGGKLKEYKFQQIIGFYIVDFCLPGKLLVIEIDGSIHEERIKEDQVRDSWLTAMGFTVIRIKNSDVDNYDLTQLAKMPNYLYNKFRSCHSRAMSIKGNTWHKTELLSKPELDNNSLDVPR